MGATIILRYPPDMLRQQVAEVIDAALEDERAAWADEAQREILLRALGRK